jgi:hypothetical protein
MSDLVLSVRAQDSILVDDDEDDLPAAPKGGAEDCALALCR